MGDLIERRNRILLNEPHLDTAQGSIASFQTDMVAPVKSLICNFLPVQTGSGDPSPSNVRPISGWDGLKIYHAGKNFLPLTWNNSTELNFPSGHTITVSSEGGNSSGQPQFVTMDGGDNTLWYITLNEGTFNDRGYRTRVNAEAFVNYRISRNAVNGQLELGSSPTSYEEWKGSINTISFPSTYYGGWIDAVRGVGEITHGYKLFDGSEDEDWRIEYYPSTYMNFYINIPDATQTTYSGQNNQLYCNLAATRLLPATKQGECFISQYKNFNAMLGDSIGNLNVPQFREWLASNNMQVVYKLATPQSFSFTPISLKTLYNQNNLWSNANGDTEVAYWTHVSQGWTPPILKIGGLPIWQDNAFYPGSNGLATQYGTNSNYFLTGIVDTGSTDQKRYDTVRIGVDSNLPVGGIRLFNDLNATSVDYWTTMRPDLSYGSITPYSFNSYGRYLILTIAKEFAADFYIKDANGNYLLKGRNVI